MRRFIVDSIPAQGETLQISDPNEFRHMTKALRLKPGDEIAVSDGHGRTGTAEILTVGKSEITLRVLSLEKTLSRHGPELVLWQGCLKSPRMDWLVEKIVELNVDEIHPLVCQFSIATKDKRERWERIAKAALKQSGAEKLVKIHDATPFSALPRFNPETDELFFLSLEEPSPQGLVEVLMKKSPGASKKIHLFVGPEGGFSTNEVAGLKEVGALPCSLGSAILRGETAGIIACGITRHWIDFLSVKTI